jgi:protein gp37
MNTKIEWTDKTWSPITGCTKIAEGCKNCYGEKMHNRLRAMGSPKYQHDWSEVRCHPEELEKPLHWKKPRKVFVCSMSDLFHKDVPDDFIDSVFDTMLRADRHTFQVLTKRPQRMANYIRKLTALGTVPLAKNIWLGVSCSTQEDVDRNLPILEKIPAAVRFVSLEPLLELVSLKKYNWLDWVIVGCESGPNRRRPDRVAAACVVADVLDWREVDEPASPIFVKQTDIDGKLVKMPKIFGRQWAEFPNASASVSEPASVFSCPVSGDLCP